MPIFYALPGGGPWTEGQEPPSEAGLGTELVTNGGFVGGATGWTSTGWTAASNQITNDPGNTNPLSQTINVENGVLYFVQFDITAWTTEDFQLKIDNVLITTFATVAKWTGGTKSGAYQGTTTGPVVLEFIPDANSDITLTNVTVRPVTPQEAYITSLADLNDNPFIQIRGNGINQNEFLGLNSGPYTIAGAPIFSSLNLAHGSSALSFNISGSENIALGPTALLLNTTGSSNVAVGSSALFNNTSGFNNIAIGVGALNSNTFGAYNVGIGTSCLSTTSSIENTGTGHNALANTGLGRGNAAFGFAALEFNDTGAFNIAIGHSAGVTDNSLDASVSGSNNIFLGAFSGPSPGTQPNNSVAIGFNSRVFLDDQVVIGGEDTEEIVFENGLVRPRDPSSVGIEIQGRTGQSANLFSVIDDSGQNLFKINEIGGIEQGSIALPDGGYVLNEFDCTISATPGTSTYFVNIGSITAPTSDYIDLSVYVYYINPGYTGPGPTTPLTIYNLSSGTGDLTTPGYNRGLFATVDATAQGSNPSGTIGSCVGARLTTLGGLKNWGVYSTSTGSKSGASNIAVLGQARNNGGGGAVSIGVFGSLEDDFVIPAPTVSAAGLFDNAGTTNDILVCQDNGASVFRVRDGGEIQFTPTTNGNLTSGTYTPTLTNVTNVAASTAFLCQFMRVGAVVTVSGKVNIDPTAVGATSLAMSLPIASNLSAEENCCGVATSPAALSEFAAILGDATNDRALVNFVASNIADHSFYFTFTYRII